MRMPRAPSRRGVLAAGMAAAAGVANAAPGGAPRVAVLDWGWAAICLALGVAPAGVAEQRLYAEWVKEPALPANTAELGLRTDPSLESLLALRPDLILTNSLNAALRPQLERIAPTLDNPTFAMNRMPLANARAATRLLADHLGRSAVAEARIAESERRFEAAKSRLAAQQGRPCIPVQVGSRHNVTYYGSGSLYADVLETIGLESAFAGATGVWGFRTDDVASLAAIPPADLLVVAPVRAGGEAMLSGPSLFASLASAGHHTIHRLPPVWSYGELTAAMRFAAFVADALTGTRAAGNGEPLHPDHGGA